MTMPAIELRMEQEERAVSGVVGRGAVGQRTGRASTRPEVAAAAHGRRVQ